MRLKKLRPDTFRYLEGELSIYHETKREIARMREDILLSSPVPDVTGIRESVPGDPTGRKATLLVTHRRLDQLERVAEAIESVVSRLPEEKLELIRLRYWARPRMLTWSGIAERLHVSRRQALRWRDEIIYALAELLGVR